MEMTWVPEDPLFSTTGDGSVPVHTDNDPTHPGEIVCQFAASEWACLLTDLGTDLPCPTKLQVTSVQAALLCEAPVKSSNCSNSALICGPKADCPASPLGHCAGQAVLLVVSYPPASIMGSVLLQLWLCAGPL